MILSLCLAAVLTLSAQAKKKRPATRPTTTPAEAPAMDPRLERMTQNTQRIIFIDSILVPRHDMLNHIQLTAQAGTISQEQDNYSYRNEVGTRSISPANNRLCESQLVNGTFSEPQELKGLYTPGVIDTLNCPFLMNDGMTLYFAAKGSESIGGYDIFVSRYNSEARQFLKPENIGMPFNSQADDLLYIIDEGLNIGYFATTRRQPAGYVCIYRFIPTTSRQTYNELPFEQLKQLAAIRNVSSTWGDGRERDEALKRIASYRAERPEEAPAMSFVINDRITYTDPSQFQSAENRALYKQLLQLYKDADQLVGELQVSRTIFEHASATKREHLKAEILDAEAQLLKLRREAQQTEKEIRNAENLLLQ